ncbi:MAG: hypothetical protein IKD69_14960 [Solobacterium sp.]|nr:hypothetical protein [Solobacterium sp.]
MKQTMKSAFAALLAVSLTACTKESTVSSVPASSTVKESSTVSPTEEPVTVNTAFAADFAAPADEYRPLTRWWVPGSMMDKEEIKAEIESMVSAGFGGAEIVPVSVAGGDGEGQLDWGSEHWKEVTKYMLEVAGENNFTIDFTMTPAWPLALPTITDVNDPAQGAQMELDGAWIDGITKEHPFTGKLPVSEEAQSDAEKVDGNVVLVGAAAAKLVDKENNTLSYDSAIVLETTDNGDGTYSASFTPEDDGEYVIYAWYQHPSGNRKYENNQVDHYSEYGSQMIIDYWENELIPYYGDAFQNVRSMFIDSLEFETHLDWTYGLQDSFKEANGYDITPYLAAVYDASDEWTAIGNYMGEPVPSFTFDKNNTELVNDFKEHLTRLYIENNIKPLAAFCAKHGITLRYQTSYGKSLDTAETALYPDIPETESLYGNDYLDFYRLQAGAVHAADKPVYSMETSAEWTETWNPKKDDGNYGTRGNGELNSGNYEQTFLDHIWHDQRAFAAGVNQVVFHGYPYRGSYNGDVVEGTQWPGFTGFESYRWSNSWGERQPNWMFAKTYTDFLTRSQFVLRQGTPKVDVAVYRHSYYEVIDFWGPDKIFMTEDLEQNGYSYDFVDPAVLSLSDMTVKDGVLDAEGTAYKALVFYNQTALSSDTVKRLQDYADNGLKIIFIGETPSEKASMQDEDITDAMNTLLANANVTVIDSIDKTLKALQDAGVEPDAGYHNETLLASHRQADDMDCYYLYNYGNTKNYREIAEAKAVDTDVTLKGEGRPYVLNAWTGTVEPAAYEETENGIITHIHLEPNDSMIIVLSKDALAEAADPAESIKEEITVEGWDLDIESWTMGDTVLDTEKTMIEVGTVNDLKAWKELDEALTDVSGIGTYTTTFTVPEDWDGLGAELLVGSTNGSLAEVTVNGQVVGVIDTRELALDISDALVIGENEISIKVASTLTNRMFQRNYGAGAGWGVEGSEGGGMFGSADVVRPQDYGLTGGICVAPYVVTPIA